MQVVSKHTEPLPGAVGSVALGGYGVEGEAALEFPDRLFLGTATGHEQPKALDGERQVGRHCGVFVDAAVGREPIELEVLRGGMEDFLPVTHDPQGEGMSQ